MWRHADPVLDRFDRERARCLPAELDDVERYRDRFLDTARMFELFLRRCEPIGPGREDEPVAVVVMPWFGTPSPWYAVALGLGLARRGRAVAFVWHDVAFPEKSPDPRLENREIGRVMATLSRRFPVLRVSDQPAERLPSTEDEALLDRLADENLMWLLRGGYPRDQDRRRRERMRHHLADALPRVRAAFHAGRFRYAVVSGGVIGASGLYLACGREAGVRIATFDAGFGATAVDVDGVAAQHTDALRAFEILAAASSAAHRDAVDAAREEFDRRRAGLDPDAYQLARPGQAPAHAEPSILIPLSVVFDAAALGLHHLFAGSEDWLVETIGTLLKETSDPILVRQHPSERRKTERSNFDARAILQEAFGSHPQVRFIAAEEDVSTYDLLDRARLVLPFVSTIGIEAAALGKPVIVSGSVYYAQLGFVWDPSSRGEYIDLLRRGARGDLPILPGQVDRAWRCYYLTAVCQRVRTNFTPQPPDLWRWVRRDPDELYNDDDVVDILTCIDEDVPLSIVRHRRRERSASQASIS
jgi:hypothetical protein